MGNFRTGVEKTPHLALNLNKGRIQISGRSTMKYPHEFYPSVIFLLEEYCNNPSLETTFVIDLEYYNTLSSRYLLKMVELISRINLKRNHSATIDWHYDPEDDGIAEDIEIFSNIIQFRINACAYELA